ncbi:UDP-glucuronate decarboxylase [Candidatus Planktophila versatilis]|uniref:UDP-glucuronic acid decarboxylase family protein n=1 Tax=Candidatus Planktophila versatilis TaxID=1884905 RepID=UPI000BAC9D26|nr:UDP-glucuronic acid decarboxylase family protein [Candidatus Planktophila versatilis]ASY18020.1 UDP-glucuronate decarboxylase [Candidatus Planktophila versatilis]
MRVVITGSAGFLGSHLADYLINSGHEVIGIDDFSTGSADNLYHLQQESKFDFIEHDIRDPIFIPSVDLILNFACPASPIHYQSDPVKTMETNFLGIVNMLHLAKKTRARLLQASTSEVYGDPQVSPQVESYWGNVNPIGIRSCYDEGKRAAETLCFDYRRQYGLDSRVIRIFNTYGPRMAENDGRVVSNFIIQALRQEELTIYGEGNQSRSFCFVSDLIKGIAAVAFAEKNFDQPVNLGNPNEFTMIELAKKVIEITGSTSTIRFLDLPQDDPRQRKPDLEFAKKYLGWEPTVQLNEGLKIVSDDFKKRIIH